MDTPALRLLVVEDDRVAATALVGTFEVVAPSTVVVVATTLAEAEAALEGRRFDAVLLDLGLPDSEGLDTFRALRGLAPESALLVVTGRADRGVAERAATLGAQDYLVKGSFSPDTLVGAVRGAVERQRLVLDLKRSQEDLQARVRQQQAVAELGTAAVAAHDLGAFFTRVTETVALTLQVELCAVLELLSDELVLRTGAGWPAQSLGHRVPTGRSSQAGFALAIGRSVITSDLASETRFAVPEPLREQGARSGASVLVPGGSGLLPGGSGPWGVLSVHSRTARTFTDNDVHFLEAVANVLGSVVSRQRAEAALREEEARFRAVVDALAEGVVLTDLERITYLNPRFEEITGYPPSQLLGQPLTRLDAMMPDLGEMRDWPARRLAGLSDVFEMPARRADGRDVWLRTFAAPLRDVAGAIVGTVAAFADVTAQRAAERARGEAEARLRQVIARSPAVLYALAPTPPHNVTWMSDNAGRILGFAPDDFRLLPDLWNKRVHPDDVGKLPELGDTLAVAEAGVTAEYRFRHADGRWLWLSDTLSVARDDGGAAIEIVGACQDVTAERQLEEQLRQAQKMEAVGRLAGGVAHDFNNLLTAIGGYSELLLMRLAENDPARHEVEEIRRAGERAATLTRQLLAFSRRQVLQPRVLDVNGVVADTERMLRRLIGEDVQLVTALAPEPLLVKADPGQLEQVVVNLVVNARDAMPRGGRLTVTTGHLELRAQDVRHPDARPGWWAFLQVADTGVGMEPEVMARIFEPFFTTKDVGKGTGLGLATVYGIVKQSGGWVEVESKPGSGSLFTIFLHEAAEPLAETPLLPLPARSGGGEMVLVVEDEASVRALVCRTLRAHGYVVLEAPSGAEALALAAHHADEIQLLVTDVVMPDLRGPELRERLSLVRPGLRTVFMSGYSEDPSFPALAAPGVSFLQKPFTPEGLTLAVREILDRADAAGNG